MGKEEEKARAVRKLLGNNYAYEVPILGENGKIVRHDFIDKKEVKKLKETYKKSTISTNVNEQLQSLEERLLQKLQTPQKKPTTSPIFDLEKQFEKFLEHRQKFDKIGKDTIRTSKSSFRYLQYFVNQDTIFNFSFFKELQKKLQDIPKNFFKYEKYYKKPFEEVLKLKEKENYETLNTKTINNHMSKYQTFFDFLMYEEIIGENPMNNIKPLQEEQETNKEEYSQEELEQIFTSDLEQDFKNMCKVSLYTGMRLEEVLSIKKQDIQDNLIHINIEDKSTKKHNRMIPIHQNLQNTIKTQIKANKSDFLFFNGNEEKEVKNIGKRINRRLKNIVNNQSKTFHSLRKNFSQEIELNTTSEEKIKKYLMGHSMSKDVTHMVYNRGKMNIEKLEDCINQITFKY